MRVHRANRTVVKWFTTPILSATLLFAACDRDEELLTDPPTTPPKLDLAEDEMPPEVQELLKLQLERFSTMPMMLTANYLGVTEIQGKSVNTESQNAGTSPKKLIDVPISTDAVAHENEPHVVTSTKDKKLLVVGYHFITGPANNPDVRCHARHSSDGGMTWSAPFVMRQLTPASQCSDPVLAYAPDGSRVFYVYMDIKFAPTDFDIVVSYSDDDGATWTGPFVVLDGAPNVFLYDKPWIGTPDDNPRFVYVSATRFDLIGAGPCHIVSTRSTNGGTVYEAPQTHDMGAAGCGFAAGAVVVQGSRPSGGKGGNVLVAWYHSDFDGWLLGRFRIRIRYSADFGATFGPIVDAVTDAFETPFWKGPFACYHRWWGSMFPDVEIDPSQGAHLAYTHDPVANANQFSSTTPEDGDIRYSESLGPPYVAWSAPERVNDDGTVSAQGYVDLDIMTEQTGQSSKPHLTWMDDRLPLELVAAPQCAGDVENLEYNIFYTTRQDGTWKPNVRISDRSSLSDFFFVGDYIGLSTDNGSLYTAWTDRRDKLSIFDLEDDVWGSRTHRTQSIALTSP